MLVVSKAFSLLALIALGILAQQSATAADVIHPIMDFNTRCLLGGSMDGKWVKPEAVKAALHGGEKYRLYTLGGYVGQATGSKAESAGAPCDETQVVNIAPQPKSSQNLYAVGATWAAQPRLAKQEGLNQAIYIDAVRSFLRQKGLNNPRVHLTQVLRVDLEGDGVPEVLVSATYYARPNFPSVSAGDYSIVLLRKVIQGKVQTTLLDGEVYLKGSTFAAPNEYRVSSVLDLNDDRKMEVIVYGHYYEGEFSSVYEVKGSKVEMVLECGCGA